jgi:site-specific DNA recombinase
MLFERRNVTFVSLTQSFSYDNQHGTAHADMLLAQFEREVIGEHIRYKFAASRREGMWIGGWARARLRHRESKAHHQ